MNPTVVFLPRVIVARIATMCAIASFIVAPISAQSSLAYSPSTDQDTLVRSQSVLNKRVTLRLSNASVTDVFQEIAHQIGTKIIYAKRLIADLPPVTLNTTNESAKSVFDKVLSGTDLRFVEIDGQLTLVGKSQRSAQVSSRDKTGQVMGKVIDSATQKGVVGAKVSVVGSSLATLTGANGAFQLSSIPIGAQTISVRLLGYQTKTKPVQVDTGVTHVSVLLTQATTTLTEVVTTATGNQRRVEVGNDIATINVDSVMKIMPVASLSDLLATRVPGVIVTKTSGAPGAPSKIRIRGLSSMNSTNDPIVIVDGIRMYAAQGSTGAGVNLGSYSGVDVGQSDRSTNLVARTNESDEERVLVSSPIDQIDPNTIETLDVLRGPSAVALYGTDAANGVIVVTTKRGKAGPAQWSGSVAFGSESMLGKWPDNYWRAGYRVSTDGVVGDARVRCQYVQEVVSQICIGDTLIQYQVLNAPSTTIFGRGGTQTYRTDVRGGKQGLAYAFSGAASRTNGLLKMPDADISMLEASGKDVPGWQRRPQNAEQQSGQVRLDADIGAKMGASFTHMLSRQITNSTPLASAPSVAGRLPPPDQTGIETGSGILTEIKDFRKRISSQTLKVTNALNFRMQPQSWANFDLTTGIDLSNRRDKSMIARGDCTDCRNLTNPLDFFSATKVPLGEYSTGQGTAMASTVNLRGTVVQRASQWITLRSSAGLNYQRTNTSDLSRIASDLPVGATSGNGAATISTNEFGDDRSTAGVYIETTIGFADRFYLPLALRRDAGNGLGGNVAPTFPKLSFSYLLSDQPNFDRIPLLGRVGTLRVRLAYGQAGVQPAAGAKMRLYSMESMVVDGATTPTVRIVTAGNPDVRPERSKELEGGIDIGFLNDRINLRATHYTKRTEDALVPLDLPKSLGMLSLNPTMQNIGQVRNTGLELAVDARILDGEKASWVVSASVSKNRNVLSRLGRQSIIVAQASALSTSSQQFVEGYPLYGRWARPILGYADIDQNGVITQGEYVIGDSSVYLGAPYPNYDASVNMTATFLSQFTIGASLSYQNGLTQINESLRDQTYSLVSNGSNIPLVTQAYYSALSGLPRTDIGIIQTASVLRFNAVSLNYIVPRVILRSVMSRQVTIALQGTNLGLISNYKGKDPTVNNSMGEVVRDTGILPTPRRWELSMRIN